MKTFILFILFFLTAYVAVAQHTSDPVREKDTTTNLEKIKLSNRQQRKAVMNWLKSLDFSGTPYTEVENARLYKLATTFTKLRLYPLAMKCFLKTQERNSADTIRLPVTNLDEVTFEKQLARIGPDAKPIPSKVIRPNDIIKAFEDGKQAKAYAMVFHVKQPVRGIKKAYHHISNTGHTFITLIKYNTDSTSTAMTFGFGPSKDNLLAATPLHPASSSKFTDDSGHEADEVLGKFITQRRFRKMLELIQQYDGLDYHLSKNNCTDFGLKAADLAGIEIKETTGTWPLGRGNNPAVTGQSVLQGKFRNLDTGDRQHLFVDTLNLGQNRVQ